MPNSTGVCFPWIGLDLVRLHLFSDDTRPSGFISHPVRFRFLARSNRYMYVPYIHDLSVMRNIHINYIMYINYIIWRWVCPSVHVCVHINRLGWKMDWWALNLLFVLHHFKSVYSLVTRSEIFDKPWNYISDWYVCMHYDNKWFDNLIWNTLCLLTAFLVGYLIAVIFLISMNHTWRNNFDMCDIYGAGEQLLIRFKNVCELYNLELLNLRAL